MCANLRVCNGTLLEALVLDGCCSDVSEAGLMSSLDAFRFSPRNRSALSTILPKKGAI
jgi:hypothetical protein